MERKGNLFFQILYSLYDAGILEDIILIGSWCHYFYRIYFSNAPEIPLLRTLDIDFLIPNPIKIHKDVNIPEILEKLDFIPQSNFMTGYTKYVHPELELEFLIADLGKGRGSKPYKIPKLHINAQGLRYLSLLQSHTIKIIHKDIIVTVPEPAAYILHKFIIYERRKNHEKKIRDLSSAKQIGEFLLKDKDQRKKIINIFHSLPNKWQKTILQNLKNNSETLFNLLLKQ
jgi:hypothetical protein